MPDQVVLNESVFIAVIFVCVLCGAIVGCLLTLMMQEQR